MTTPRELPREEAAVFDWAQEILLAQAYLLASSVLGLSQRWALLCAPLCFLG
jgi:hypothetical protein